MENKVRRPSSKTAENLKVIVCELSPGMSNPNGLLS